MQCVSKDDTDVAHYNFNAHQPISVIFGGDAAERVCYRMMICFPTSPNYCLCSTWGNMETRKSRLSNAVLMVCRSSAMQLLLDFFNIAGQQLIS